MQTLLRSMMLFALVALLFGACGEESESGSGNDAGTDAGAGTGCDSDGTVCEHGCDGTNCYADCNPSDNCCTGTGTWRTDCTHGCDMGTGSCNDCNPSDDCCDGDWTWKSAEVQQPDKDLYWLRCPLGQSWVVGESCGCTDSPGVQSMTWCEVMDLPPGDSFDGPCYDHPITAEHVDICESEYGVGYRLPTREELEALLGGCAYNDPFYECNTCSESANCTDMFGLDLNWYWSSSPETSFHVWVADFSNGAVEFRSKIANYEVRCMRTGT